MNRNEHLLVILSEEACEVAKEADKCLRFGPAEVYPEIGVSNALRVVVEMHDLWAVLEMLQADGVIPAFAWDRSRLDEKKKKVERLLLHSARCGTLHADVQPSRTTRA